MTRLPVPRAVLADRVPHRSLRPDPSISPERSDLLVESLRDGRLRLTQLPDETACGSAALVVARMLVEPSFRRGIWGPDPTATRQRFADALTATHRRTNAVAPLRGQWGWPRRLGTSPEGMSGELDRIVPTTRYRTRLVHPDHLDRAWHDLSVTASSDRPVALFIGTDLLPRHIVLAVGVDDDACAVYEPSSGRVVSLPRSEFLADDVSIAGGWRRPWALVLPTLENSV
ncbi:hypothetical protein [Williamsia sterculiae]|uniref:Peptidase_C39 like family protein n=1 Tax=Williamsia sterculiae TaxID=1344003 RepID=A0A1N7DFU5_9NOCA|nr:hypothetical protein [Williamsia sterculiae]SIR74688.1 hypothetical protein SAMN05445060_0603 [Williamsia sterculiae]